MHKSQYSPEDKEVVISARIEGDNDIKTCRIYEDGMGTTKKGEDRD